MHGPAIAQALEAAFKRDGFKVQRTQGAAGDSDIERNDRRMVGAGPRLRGQAPLSRVGSFDTGSNNARRATPSPEKAGKEVI